jgi:hypothetical protein
MNDSRQSRNRGAQDDIQTNEWPDKLTVAQAHRFLGVSSAKMTQLLSRGLLKAHKNPIDLREKLIKRSELEAFLNEHGHD